jgi:hypothetical protein
MDAQDITDISLLRTIIKDLQDQNAISVSHYHAELRDNLRLRKLIHDLRFDLQQLHNRFELWDDDHPSIIRKDV